MKAWQRARLKAQLEAFLVDTCSIEAQTTVRGSLNVPTNAWFFVATNEPCRVITMGQQNTGTAGVVGAQESLRHDYRLIVRSTVALAINQRITTGGKTYNVIKVLDKLTEDLDAQAIMTRQD